MTATTRSRPAPSAATPPPGPQPPARRWPRQGWPRRRWLVAGVLGCWLLAWVPLRDRATLPLAPQDLAPLHRQLTALREHVDTARGDGGWFAAGTDLVRGAVDLLTTGLQDLISQPSFGRPVPLIGWLGVLVAAACAGYLVAGLRLAVLAAAGFASFGLLGLWRESMDTLALTVVAVGVCVLVGVPLGIWLGSSPRIARLVTPVLESMQTLPTFVYLAPLTLVFLIGPASAVIATMVYALPPVVKITAHGLLGVPASVVEAGVAQGATGWQLLTRIRLPMAGRMIAVGVNQTTMCALSMVTIAALIDAPGLGRTVVQALAALDVGTAFAGGLAIVAMAIVLDRLTTAVGARTGQRQRWRTPAARRRRRAGTGVALVATAVALWLSHTLLWAAQFPATAPDAAGHQVRGLLGGPLIAGVDTADDWSRTHLAGFTGAVKDAVTYGVLNPLEALLGSSPWPLVALVVLALAGLLAGWRAAAVCGGCLALLLGTGLWQAAMATLAATLVATAVVLVCGVAGGVWLGRDPRADRLVRPALDAAQVLPAFVYLVPCLGLFGATRFTAIVAAVVFAAPVSIKLVAEGVRAVPPAVVEAAVCAGATPWQVITKVQLPLAARSVALAVNQGLIYVMSMVVVGGLVGAGALGYLVVAGFSQSRLYGKGLAAGIAIVALGVLLDRTTQAAARRLAVAAGTQVNG